MHQSRLGLGLGLTKQTFGVDRMVVASMLAMFTVVGAMSVTDGMVVSSSLPMFTVAGAMSVNDSMVVSSSFPMFTVAGAMSVSDTMTVSSSFPMFTVAAQVYDLPGSIAFWFDPSKNFSAGSWAPRSEGSVTTAATQATGAKQPTLSANGFGAGIPGIAFASASNQYLQAATAYGLSNNDGSGHQTNFTVAIAGQSLATNVQMEWIDLGDTTTGQGFGLGTDLASTGLRGGEHGGVGGTMSWGSATTSAEYWVVQRNTTTVSVTVNGSVQTVTNPTQNINQFTAQTTIASRTNGSTGNLEPLNGLLGHIIGWNSVLSGSDITKVNNFYKQVYGF